MRPKCTLRIVPKVLPKTRLKKYTAPNEPKFLGNYIRVSGQTVYILIVDLHTTLLTWPVNIEHPLMSYTVLELQAVVQFLTVRWETVALINVILRDTYAANNMPDESTIRQWRRDFLNWWLSLEDEEWTGQPGDNVTPENIAHIQKLIKEDSRYTLTELELRMPDDCRRSSMRRILHNELHFCWCVVGGYLGYLLMITKKCTVWQVSFFWHCPIRKDPLYWIV